MHERDIKYAFSRGTFCIFAHTTYYIGIQHLEDVKVIVPVKVIISYHGRNERERTKVRRRGITESTNHVVSESRTTDNITVDTGDIGNRY